MRLPYHSRLSATEDGTTRIQTIERLSDFNPSSTQKPHETTKGVQRLYSQKPAAKWAFPNLSEIFQKFPTVWNATEIETERARQKAPSAQGTASRSNRFVGSPFIMKSRRFLSAF
jgi:hypothetical protein